MFDVKGKPVRFAALLLSLAMMSGGVAGLFFAVARLNEIPITSASLERYAGSLSTARYVLTALLLVVIGLGVWTRYKPLRLASVIAGGVWVVNWVPFFIPLAFVLGPCFPEKLLTLPTALFAVVWARSFFESLFRAAPARPPHSAGPLAALGCLLCLYLVVVLTVLHTLAWAYAVD